MQNNNLGKSRVIYIDVVQDDNYRTLVRIADTIIKKFLEKGVTTEKELDKVRMNARTQMYELKFHMTAIYSHRNRTMDATDLLAQFGDASLGKCTLKEVHISSRSEFEEEGGQRMARNLFDQIKNHGASYACESKIMLNYDDF
mmetsp:Transcript_752/g.1128  ORF Transcript_752/g.1128 Transcript_752/m.1128 type:complete len:143 (-) Transcript_752:34-462(-)